MTSVELSDPRLSDEERLLEVLRRVAHAGGTLEPRFTPEQAEGFAYLADSSEIEATVRRDLDYLARRDYLRQDFHERQLLCPICDSRHLNVREVCIACGSSNLSFEPLLHHYRCGYVGVVGNFDLEGDARVCPKCSGRLRNRGTDHEEAGQQFQCRRCYASFEEPNVRALCYGCGNESPADRLAARDIMSYQLTGMGHAAIRRERLFEGRDEALTEPGMRVFRASVYRSLLMEDLRRLRRYNIAFALAVVRLYLPPDPGRRDAAEQQALQFISNSVREVDQIGRWDAQGIAVSLPQTPSDAAELVRQRLEAGRGLPDDVALGCRILDPAALDDVEAAIDAALADLAA
jgi:hypothetical protein